MSRILIMRECSHLNNMTYGVPLPEGYNSGNDLWLAGLLATISTPENEIVFEGHFSDDYINSNFDCAIRPAANIFNRHFCQFLLGDAKRLRNIRIPTYVISCGAQLEKNDTVRTLCSDIGNAAKAYIESVYKTGGKFALRGYITKDLFDQLGYHSAVVTGCPSLYQKGRNLQIKKTSNMRRPVLNGMLNDCYEVLREIPEAIFIDQSRYWENLFARQSLKLIDTIKKRGRMEIEMLASDRIFGFLNLNDWISFLVNNNFDFSFGSRIHGNIMSILAGIPSMVYTFDSRTREMAEFYSIPSKNEPCKSKNDLERCFVECNYTEFNKVFPSLYDEYERFLKERSIISSNMDTARLCYLGNKIPDGTKHVNIDYYTTVFRKLKRNPLYNTLEFFRTVRRELMN